jgi:glutathione S-transferase
MLTLYYKPSCPFCQKVIAHAATLNLTLQLKNIREDTTYYQELIDLGGKSQVPFLVDTDTNTALYESDDINAYLDAHRGADTTLRVHRSSDSSPVCL